MMLKQLSLFTIITAFFCIGLKNNVAAQTADSPWAVGVHGGLTRLNDDFKNNYFNTHHQKKIMGFTLQRYFNSNFDFVSTLMFGDVRTFNTMIKQSLTTTARSGDVSALYKIGSEQWMLRPYISGGIGLLYADNYLARDQWDFTIPVGAGLRFAPTEMFNLDFNIRQFTNFGDKLDGKSGGTYNDNYLSYTAGVIFVLGKAKDTDGDGIKDKNDKCPGTKAGVMVDEKGCPLDTDGDGVNNSLDKCPEVTGLAKFDGCPDGDGDGVEDSKDACPKVAGVAQFNGCPDTDKDGIEDSKDMCPNVAGIAQFNGCPDTDKDGVEDSKDKCPDVAGTVAFEGCSDGDSDGIVDYKDRCPAVAGIAEFGGCPAPKAADIKKLEAIAKKINFETGKATMKPASFIVLDQVVVLMKANPGYKLSVEGHTDNVGSSKMNLELSQNRADAVKNYLVSKGIDSANIVSAGFGDTKPIDDNKTLKGKANNRRSELKLF